MWIDGVTGCDADIERTLVSAWDSAGDGDGGAVYGTMMDGIVVRDTVEIDGDSVDSS